MNIRAKVDSSNNLKNSTNSLQLESIKDSDEYDNISPEKPYKGKNCTIRKGILQTSTRKTK